MEAEYQQLMAKSIADYTRVVNVLVEQGVVDAELLMEANDVEEEEEEEVDVAELRVYSRQVEDAVKEARKEDGSGSHLLSAELKKELKQCQYLIDAVYTRLHAMEQDAAHTRHTLHTYTTTTQQVTACEAARQQRKASRAAGEEKKGRVAGSADTSRAGPAHSVASIISLARQEGRPGFRH